MATSTPDDHTMRHDVLTEPNNGPVGSNCSLPNTDGDTDVDLEDYMKFMTWFPGV